MGHLRWLQIRPWSYSDSRMFLETRLHCDPLAPPRNTLQVRAHFHQAGLLTALISEKHHTGKLDSWSFALIAVWLKTSCSVPLYHGFLTSKPVICCQAYKYMALLIHSSKQRINHIAVVVSKLRYQKKQQSTYPVFILSLPPMLLCSVVKFTDLLFGSAPNAFPLDTMCKLN